MRQTLCLHHLFMFRHPNTTWKSYFPNRNLAALSVAPLLGKFIYKTIHEHRAAVIEYCMDNRSISQVGLLSKRFCHYFWMCANGFQNVRIPSLMLCCLNINFWLACINLDKSKMLAEILLQVVDFLQYLAQKNGIIGHIIHAPGGFRIFSPSRAAFN